MKANTFNVFTGNPIDKEAPQVIQRGRGSMKLDPEVQLSRDLYYQYQGGKRATWVTNAKADEDFRNGAQLTLQEINDLKAKGHPPVIVNVIRPAVEQGKALLTSNKPRFSSTGREDSDTKTGAIFSQLMTYIWDISDGNTELKQAIDDYYVKGMGVLLPYFDPLADFGKGEIYLKSIDPFYVFIDPNSKDRFARDAAHILIVDSVTQEEAFKEFPDLQQFEATLMPVNESYLPPSATYGLEGQTEVSLDQYHTHYERIDRYSKIKMKYFHVFDANNGMEKIMTGEEVQSFLEQPAFILQAGANITHLTSDEQVAQATAQYQQLGPVFHTQYDQESGQEQQVPGDENEDAQAVPQSTVKLIPTNMAEMIKEQVVVINEVYVSRIKRVLSIGGKLVYNGVMPIEDYPPIFLMNQFHRDPFPSSDVRDVRGVQEYINKIRSLIVAHAASSTSVKLLIPRGSMDRKILTEEWGRAGTGVIEFDPELGTPIVAGPIALPNELYKNEADARKDVQESFGIYALMAGDSAQAPSTFKGTVALDEYGQRRIKSKKDDVESALNQAAKVIVQLIQAYYQEPKAIRLLKPNNPPEQVAINQPIYDDVTGRLQYILNDVTVGKYDVVVVSGSMLPSNRFAQMEYYMDLYSKGIIDQVEVLKKSEVIDVEGVLNRFSEIAKLQQALQQAQTEIKNLQGDLQTAQRETLHARQEVEVTKFKGDLGGIKSRAEAAHTIYQKGLQSDRQVAKAKFGEDLKGDNS